MKQTILLVVGAAFLLVNLVVGFIRGPVGEADLTKIKQDYLDGGYQLGSWSMVDQQNYFIGSSAAMHLTDTDGRTISVTILRGLNILPDTVKEHAVH